MISLTPHSAHEDCVRVIRARQAGSRLPLDGMTLVVKDNIDVGGVPGTVGSAHFRQRRPARDAFVVHKIRRAGGVLLGTANLHELAFGGTSDNPYFGAVRNPWAPDRIAGGSSGGSAVAVAAGWSTAALGTDTGGSVRCPASMTGITGLRPTFGSISSEGVFPLARTFDTVGFLARSAANIKQLMMASGWHGATSQTSGGVRIGLPSNPYFSDVADSTLLSAVGGIADILEARGHTVCAIEVPAPEQCDRVARQLVRTEAYALHQERLAVSPENFGPDVRRRLLLGGELDPAAIVGLRQQRRQLAAKMKALFASVDFLLLPTVPVLPALVGQGDMIEVTERNLAFTYLWGVAGLPAISFPCGFSSEGLPVGAQLVGPPGSDRSLCDLVRMVQAETTWHERRPYPLPVR